MRWIGSEAISLPLKTMDPSFLTQQSDDALQKSGFSDPVASEQGEGFPLFQGDVDAVENMRPAVITVQAFDLQDHAPVPCRLVTRSDRPPAGRALGSGINISPTDSIVSAAVPLLVGRNGLSS